MLLSHYDIVSYPCWSLDLPWIPGFARVQGRFRADLGPVQGRFRTERPSSYNLCYQIPFKATFVKSTPALLQSYNLVSENPSYRESLKN